jgi:hypothetical protein
MKHTIKLILATASVALLAACGGGGGGGTTYQTTFNANVSGLSAGESVTVVASLYADKTLTQTSVVSQNGLWSSTINLPNGNMFAFDTKIQVTQQPTGKSCTVTYSNLDVTSTGNTIKCAPISAAGLYVGKLGASTGVASLVILNDGSNWLWYGTETASVSTYNGLIQSDTGISSLTNYTSTGGVTVGSNPLRSNSSLTGAYVANTSFTGSVTDLNVPYALTLTAPSAVAYQFSEVPLAANIVGNYASASDTFSVGSTGILNGSKPSGCQYFGTVTPKNTGENLYNVTVTYGGSPCDSTQQGATLKGIALLIKTTSGMQFFGAVVNNSKTTGNNLIAVRK